MFTQQTPVSRNTRLTSRKTATWFARYASGVASDPSSSGPALYERRASIVGRRSTDKVCNAVRHVLQNGQRIALFDSPCRVSAKNLSHPHYEHLPSPCSKADATGRGLAGPRLE